MLAPPGPAFLRDGRKERAPGSTCGHCPPPPPSLDWIQVAVFSLAAQHLWASHPQARRRFCFHVCRRAELLEIPQASAVYRLEPSSFPPVLPSRIHMPRLEVWGWGDAPQKPPSGDLRCTRPAGLVRALRTVQGPHQGPAGALWPRPTEPPMWHMSRPHPPRLAPQLPLPAPLGPSSSH